jgi:flagellar hook-associated protein 1 FlgK
MSNYGVKILNNAISSLSAQQALIANTANNVANVNTPGYTRRQVELGARADTRAGGSGIQVGSGVEVTAIKRIADDFVTQVLRSASGTLTSSNVTNDYLGRVQELFSLDGRGLTIGSTMNSFLSSLNQLSLSPANIDLRLNVMQRGEELVSSIRTVFDTVAQVQGDLNNRVIAEVESINSFTKQIATLNDMISRREASGIAAIDERDQRDLLLQRLAEKIDYKLVDNKGGVLSISLDNGFPLVNGSTSRDLSVTAAPSFSGGSVPPSLSGEALNYVVYDYGPSGSPSHIDLTQVIKAGSGSLGAILQLRGYAAVTNTSAFQADGILVGIASRVEALTRSMLVDMNRTYLGDTPGNAGDLNGNSPGPFGLFDFTSSGVKDDGDGIPEYSDLTNPALGIDNFSSILTFAVTNPSNLAAARDIDPNPATVLFQSGDGRNAQALAQMSNRTLTFSVGPFSFTGTFDELYNASMAYVGNAKKNAETAVRVAEQSFNAAANRRDEVSGVSLDEEFANLVKYQKAFQASARMIKTAGDLLDQIVSLI